MRDFPAELENYRVFFVDFHWRCRHGKRVYSVPRTSLCVARAWYAAHEVARAIYGEDLISVTEATSSCSKPIFEHHAHIFASSEREWEILR